MFYYIYRIPLPITVIIIAAAVVGWALIMRFSARRGAAAVRAINIILVFIALGGILYITLHHRLPGQRELILMPFHSFIEAKAEREMYREMLMNLFLFVPLGVTMPFALLKNGVPASSQRLKNILVTVAFALILSLAIESIQYFFALGRAETDDVICNTSGALAGILSFAIYSACGKHNNDH